MSEEEIDLEPVIKEIGQFGKFQLLNYILISIPILFIGIYSLSYIFTTEDLNYRCVIPNCDGSNPDQRIYNPEWLKYAVPFEDDLPKQCERFVPVDTNSSDWQCTEEYFTNNLENDDCDEFVYETIETNIVNEVK